MRRRRGKHGPLSVRETYRGGSDAGWVCRLCLLKGSLRLYGGAGERGSGGRRRAFAWLTVHALLFHQRLPRSTGPLSEAEQRRVDATLAQQARERYETVETLMWLATSHVTDKALVSVAKDL